MKFTSILLFVALTVTVGCANQETESAAPVNQGTHVHDDGSVHDDHADSLHTQEEFSVDADSTSEHTHNGDENHSHN